MKASRIPALRRRLTLAEQEPPCPACSRRVPAKVATALVRLAVRAATEREALGRGPEVDGPAARRALRNAGLDLLSLAERVLPMAARRRSAPKKARR